MRLINTLYNGGIVTDNTPEKLSQFEAGNNDSQFFYLSSGSLVIPRKHVPIVKAFMEQEGLEIPPYQHPVNPQLTKLVVGELVIPPGHMVYKVNRFLRSQGIKLQGTEDLI